ncbi:hypothetical protein GCM10010978_28900 [Compostibacillus humi]|jgi:predicted DNA-binding transcriptional regulator YafY|uniref:WYL domain-containing protein n=1 Tax=Compostibacillus humi TaxID=1245525 RepID=A0A8J2XH88_9BACI|nr:hypothetical protein [Compostibacillus humi]GFZ87326.1 hypothetical protein GCM10010978_28900 [Compostibacillus humi]HLT55264.1 hypothetical protein [Bacillota bacterium]
MEKLFLRSMQTKEKLEIIYLSQENDLSQRTIRVIKLRENHILAFCYARQKLRIFRLDNILAVYPFMKKMGA